MEHKFIAQFVVSVHMHVPDDWAHSQALDEAARVLDDVCKQSLSQFVDVIIRKTTGTGSF